MVSSRCFHHLLALLTISSWCHLHVLVLSILSSSPLAVFLIPDITAWHEWPPHALYCSSIWFFRHCSNFLPNVISVVVPSTPTICSLHLLDRPSNFYFSLPFLLSISLYFCSVFCTISSTLFSNTIVRVFLFYYIFYFKSYILSMEWFFFFK